MTATVDLDLFQKQGYVVLDVLSPEQLVRLRAAADELMRQDRFAGSGQFHYIALVMPGAVNPTLLEALDHPVLTTAAQAILGGGPLALDNAVMLAADPGVSYRQGWHRDVLQVPEADICDEMFSPRWHHNNVQLNLALADDAAFWTVPGSHRRPNTPDERRAFGGTKHMSAPEVDMPGSICLQLRAGQAAIYNNNLIHRGYCDFTSPRRAMHIGYHNTLRPPTWHFYSFDDPTISDEHLAALPANARRWMLGRRARREQFPEVAASYKAGLAPAD